MPEPDFRYMSLGAGVQSTAMFILAVRGEIPRPAIAIFADTGDEPPWVYEQVERLQDFSRDIEIRTVKAGPLSEKITEPRSKSVFIPAFVDTGGPKRGMLFRTCTERFKIRPIKKLVKQLMGFGLRDTVTRSAACQLGISMDEVQRMKPNPLEWATNEFPLIDLRLSREGCRRIVLDAGMPEPQKSACVY